MREVLSRIVASFTSENLRESSTSYTSDILMYYASHGFISLYSFSRLVESNLTHWSDSFPDRFSFSPRLRQTTNAILI